MARLTAIERGRERPPGFGRPSASDARDVAVLVTSGGGHEVIKSTLISWGVNTMVLSYVRDAEFIHHEFTARLFSLSWVMKEW